MCGGEVVIVQSTGALRVVRWEECMGYKSMDGFYEESGGVGSGGSCIEEFVVPRVQGMGRRWSHIPWTGDMERSCRPWRVAVRLWNENSNGVGAEEKRANEAGLDA